jgi:hypothetical protein
MANTVLTSKNRILGLPVSIKELDRNESVVATSSPLGYLGIVVDKNGIEILHDYSTLDPTTTNPICVPSIEVYRTLKMDALVNELETLGTLKETHHDDSV